MKQTESHAVKIVVGKRPVVCCNSPLFAKADAFGAHNFCALAPRRKSLQLDVYTAQFYYFVQDSVVRGGVVDITLMISAVVAGG